MPRDDLGHSDSRHDPVFGVEVAWWLPPFVAGEFAGFRLRPVCHVMRRRVGSINTGFHQIWSKPDRGIQD
ncbi:MAG: hypothetical protein IPK02_20515 [Candidatus Accumulibacter sp.]|uniref:Uncharacterized protein n=1 Tax=Candidatus Accumulibacter affinis TaxID=2954384 RepID=A0A935TF24_9PROT|nr:hypothetical protein [Candidatus Accumulibacter affinis]